MPSLAGFELQRTLMPYQSPDLKPRYELSTAKKKDVDNMKHNIYCAHTEPKQIDRGQCTEAFNMQHADGTLTSTAHLLPQRKFYLKSKRL
jgi:hypothetical protein